VRGPEFKPQYYQPPQKKDENKTKQIHNPLLTLLPFLLSSLSRLVGRKRCRGKEERKLWILRYSCMKRMAAFEQV
jgi:hypothetical protein